MENEEEVKEEVIERKNEPAGISREDMEASISKAVADAVAATREEMKKMYGDQFLKSEVSSKENVESYSELVEDLL